MLSSQPSRRWNKGALKVKAGYGAKRGEQNVQGR